MCLAEALLRIPDAATRDALIRDKIASGDWQLAPRPEPVAVRQRRHLGPAAHRQAGRDAQRRRPRRGASARRRPRRRAADPQRRRHGDAPDGRAVRHRRDDRAGARQRPAARGRGLPLLVRHARRGGDDRARCRALPRRLRSRDPGDRPRLGRPRHRRGARHLDQALGPASALQPGAGRAGDGRALSAPAAARRARAAATTSASTSMPRRPTASSSRSTCSSGSASSPRSPAGTASASSSRPTRSAARRWSTGSSTWPGAAAAG